MRLLSSSVGDEDRAVADVNVLHSCRRRPHDVTWVADGRPAVPKLAAVIFSVGERLVVLRRWDDAEVDGRLFTGATP